MDPTALTEALRQAPETDRVLEARALLASLQTRVVREATRDTWFVVNRSDQDLTSIPVQMQGERSVRRVQVNGETATFEALPDGLLLVTTPRPLRPGAGTLVVVQWR